MDAPLDPIPMLDLTLEVDELRTDISAAIDRVLRSGQFILGPEVEAFEREAAAFLNVEHAVGLNSGTDALIIGLRALGVGPGDEVITTAYSFFATAEAIGLVGAAPVFVDIDPDTLNLDPAAVERAITERTKAILPVHLFGRPADMERILGLAEARGLFVLEDCAQSFGATLADGRPAGSVGHAGAFSFYPTKNLGAYGDGGMLVTNDDAVARRIRSLRGHGSPPGHRYRHERLGYNSRLDEIQAAVLRLKLPRVRAENARRRAIAGRYGTCLDSIDGVDVPAVVPGHVFHQYALLVPAERRDHVRAELDRAGIGSSVFYPETLARSFACATGAPSATFPQSEAASRRVINLPIWPGLRDDQVDRVANVVRRALEADG